MGLVSLLRFMGTKTPRYVTVEGRVVLGANGTSVSGVATQLEPHTFHGGVAEAVPVAPESQWWDDPARKARDIEAMRAAFRDVEVLDDDMGLAYFVGFNTGKGIYHCLIMPRPNGNLPRVVPIKPKRLGRREAGRFRRAPHLFDDDSLCVADRSDWIPVSHTTIVAACWTAHWLACYTDWRITGIWPVEGVDSPDEESRPAT